MTNLNKQNEVMTLSEVADYLKVAEKTVLRMIQKGEIPCAKVASQWRFMRTMIDDWLFSKMNVIPKNDMANLLKQEGSLVPLSRLIKKENINLNLEEGSKESLIKQLLSPFTKQLKKQEIDKLILKLLQRESLSSTAIGNKIAIPHLRRPEESLLPGPEVVVGICPKGCNFDSFDSKKTYLFFLIITDSEVIHLRVLSLISQLSNKEDLVSCLINSKSEEEFIGTLIQSEQRI